MSAVVTNSAGVVICKPCSATVTNRPKAKAFEKVGKLFVEMQVIEETIRKLVSQGYTIGCIVREGPIYARGVTSSQSSAVIDAFVGHLYYTSPELFPQNDKNMPEFEFLEPPPTQWRKAVLGSGKALMTAGQKKKEEARYCLLLRKKLSAFDIHVPEWDNSDLLDSYCLCLYGAGFRS